MSVLRPFDVILVLTLGAVSAAAAATESDSLDTQLVAIEKAIEEGRKTLGVPGVAVAVIKDGRVVFNKGFGLRDIEKGLPVTPNTLFAIGSCTKAFTAMAAVIAADEGKLSLEDSPKRFLPYFKLRDPEADAAVTLQDLLSHRSGLGRFDLAWYTGVLTRKEVIKAAGLAVPTAKLREKYQYQNSMYSAAGEMVGAANRSTWEAVIARRFFKPLGMKSSNTTVEEMQRAGNFSSGYNLANGVASRVPMRPLQNIAPAGDINSTASDMAQWIRLMLNGGVFESKRIVSEKGFAELTTPQISIDGSTAYGLGWVLLQWQGHKVVFHDGGIDGFNASVGFMPDKKVGFVILTNVSSSPLLRIAQEAIWSNLVGQPPAPPKYVSPPPSGKPQQAGIPNDAPKIEITVDELMAKVIDAAGGEANLRKRRSALMRWDLDLENQGLLGEMTIHTQAPNSILVQTTLFGLGKNIGTLRSNFDGAKGAEESSFSPARAFDEKQIEDLRVAADFYELLNWRTLYKEVKIAGKSRVSDEEVYVIRKIPERAHPVTDFISTNTFLLLKRNRLMSMPGGLGAVPVSETYSDHRTVDGTVIPFQLVIQNIAGRIVGRLKEVHYNVDRPPSEIPLTRLLTCRSVQLSRLPEPCASDWDAARQAWVFVHAVCRALLQTTHRCKATQSAV